MRRRLRRGVLGQALERTVAQACTPLGVAGAVGRDHRQHVGQRAVAAGALELGDRDVALGRAIATSPASRRRSTRGTCSRPARRAGRAAACSRAPRRARRARTPRGRWRAPRRTR